MLEGTCKGSDQTACMGRLWSEPLLVTHTPLLEISCHGSFINASSIGKKIGLGRGISEVTGLIKIRILLASIIM